MMRPSAQGGLEARMFLRIPIGRIMVKGCDVGFDEVQMHIAPRALSRSTSLVQGVGPKNYGC